MIRRPPRSTRTDTLFPYPTLFRSVEQAVDAERGIIAHRLVEHCLEILLAVVAQAQLRARLLLVAGLAGDDRDRTGGGVAAEQRALWTLEHLDRSEERREGKECVSTCRSRGSASH